VCLGRGAVQADADGLASASAGVEVSSNRPAQVDLHLSHGVSPHGRATDSSGRGIAGVAVSICYARDVAAGAYPNRWEVETDAEGNYAAPGLVVPGFTIIARCKGFLLKECEPAEKGASRIDVTLVREGALEGAVKMHGRVAFPESIVLGLRQAASNEGQFSGYGDHAPDGRPRVTREGVFRLEGISPGRYVMQARIKGMAIGESEEFDLREGETVHGVVVELVSSCGIRGTIRDARTGAPIPRAMYGEMPWEEGKGGGYSSQAADEEGRFGIRDLGPGRHRVRVSDTKLASKEISVDLHEGEVLDQDIVLDDGARITGRVLLDGAVPKKAVGMQASSPIMEQRYLACGEDGAFEVAGLGPGAWYISAGIGIQDPKTQFAAVRTVDVGKEVVPTIEFDFRSSPQVRGSIRQGGTPLAKGAFYFLGQGAHDGWGWVIWTDEKGDFAARGLPPGDYVVIVATGWPQVAPDPATGLQRIAHGPADPVVRVPAGNLDSVVIDLPAPK